MSTSRLGFPPASGPARACRCRTRAAERERSPKPQRGPWCSLEPDGSSGLRRDALDANICSCRGRPRSCTRTSTRSTRRSSSGTIRALRGRPVIVGGGVVLAASYEAKARGVKTAMGGRRALAAVPGRGRGPAADRGLLRGEQGGVRDLRRHDAAGRGPLDRRGVPRRPRHAADRGHAARDRRAAQAPRARGGRAADHGRHRDGPSTWPRSRAPSRSPTGCSMVPAGGELAFLHPLPVERLWGVGPVTAGKLHAHGDHDRRRGRAAERERARLAARPRRRPPAARARPQPRSAAGTGRRPAALDRRPVRARLAAEVVGGGRRDARRAGRPPDPPAAQGPAGRPHRRPAPALRRLLARHALAHAAGADRRDADDPRHRPRPARRRPRR